ncbi:Sister chromatid cohesion protein 2 [Savitreella phatthalungensis]
MDPGDDKLDKMLACTPLLSALSLDSVARSIPPLRTTLHVNDVPPIYLPDDGQPLTAQLTNALLERAALNMASFRTSHRREQTNDVLAHATFLRIQNPSIKPGAEHFRAREVSQLLSRFESLQQASGQNTFPEPARHKSEPVPRQQPLSPVLTFRTKVEDPLPAEPAPQGQPPKKRQKVEKTQKKARASAQTSTISEEPQDDRTTRSLQELVTKIFDADDRLSADEQADSAESSDLFISSDENATLTTEALDRLLYAIRLTLTSTGVLEILQASRLLSILQRCVATIELIVLTEDANEEAQASWFRGMAQTNDSANACKCILLLLANVSTDTDTGVTEELLLNLFEALKNNLESTHLLWMTMPMPPKMQSDQAQKARAVLQSHLEMMDVMTHVLAASDLSDDVVSRAEFLALDLFFADTTPSKDSALADKSQLSRLRALAHRLLFILFARKPSQRSFIRHEVLASLKRLPSSLTSNNVVRISGAEGRPPFFIRHTTVLLIDLVQACALIPEHVNNDAESNLVTRATQTKASAEETAATVVSYLLGNALAATKDDAKEATSAQSLFTAFCDDVVQLYTLPSHPGADAYIRALFVLLCQALDRKDLGAFAKATVLDHLSKLAANLRAQALVADHDADPNISGKELSNLLEWVSDRTFPSRLQAGAHYIVTSAVVSSSKILIGDADKPLENAQAIYDLLADVDPFETDKLDTERRLATEKIWLDFLRLSGLFKLFELVIPRILTVIEHPLITLRSKALRTLSTLADIDVDILGYKAVQTKISDLLVDPSPQVRDSALELLGKYIASDSTHADYFLDLIGSRMQDPALSVRKRIVRLMRDLFAADSRDDLRDRIARLLLRAVGDEEESIQSSAVAAFEHIFATSVKLDAESDLNEQLARKLPQEKALLEASRRRLAYMFRTVEDRQQTDLQSLLHKLDETAKTDSSHLSFSLLFQVIAKLAVQHILNDEVNEAETLSNILLLRGLAKSVPQHLTISDVEPLRLFLSPANIGKADAALPVHVADILTRILRRADTAPKDFLVGIEAAIVPQLTRVGMVTLSALLPCLCRAVALNRDYTKVVHVLKTCLISLSKTEKDGRVPTSTEAVLLLSIMGLLGRFLPIRNSTFPLSTLDASDAQAVSARMASLATTFVHSAADKDDFRLQRAAIQALGNVCIASPRLFLEKSAMDALDLCAASPRPDLSLAVLSILRDYLQTDAERNPDEALLASKRVFKKDAPVDAKRKRQQQLTGSNLPVIDEAVGTSLAQHYLPIILQAALAYEAKLGLVSLELISLILTGLLVSPRLCTAHVVALTFSDDPVLQESALSLLRTVHERHESQVDDRYIDGLKLATQYCRSTVQQLGTAVTHSHALITPVYSIVRHRRKSRKKFLQAIGRAFHVDIDALTSSESTFDLSESQVAYAKLIAHDLACLDFSLHEEVMLIISGINKGASDAAIQLASILRDEPLGSVNTQLARAAAILALALQLAPFLQRLYGIKSALLAAYDPSKAHKDSRQAVRKPDIPIPQRLEAAWRRGESDSDRVALFNAVYTELEETSLDLVVGGDIVDDHEDDDSSAAGVITQGGDPTSLAELPAPEEPN